MSDGQIRFNDGAGYERMMGVWSRLAGAVFLDWLEPPPGLRWLDVGCGNGALTTLLAGQCAPRDLHGIDPSDAQLAFARTRSMATPALFRQGDAMALPFADDAFDAAVMGLVIFFVPEPARAVAEMARVVVRGGTVAAYVWDMLGGGFPLDALQVELRGLGVEPPLPPSAAASRMPALLGLWAEAGLHDVETREIVVERTFADFDDLWATSLLGTSVGPTIAGLPPPDIERLRAGLRARLPAGADGRITFTAHANAVRGRV